MKYLNLRLLVVAFIGFNLIGCAGSKPASGYNSTIPEEINKLIENEYKNALTAVGSAEGEREDICIRKAELQARASLAREFKIQIDQLQKSYEESVNNKNIEEYSQVIESFSTIELKNSKIVKSLIKKQKNGLLSAKVLVTMSADDIKNSIEEKLGTYTSFRASKAYKELEERVRSQN